MASFTIKDRSEALYYYNALASQRVVNGTYYEGDKLKTFIGIVKTIEPSGSGEELGWTVTVSEGCR